MKRLYTTFMIVLSILFFSAQAQTITINSPTTGQVITIGSTVTVNFSTSGTLTYGVIQMYKGATPVGSAVTGASYPGTNYSLGTSSMVAGTDYRVRVRDAANPSRDAYSGYFTLQVLPPPVATGATSVTSTSFVANWNPVSGATAYYFDLSVASDFSSFVSGYNNLNTSGLTGGTTSKVIYADLSPGSSYYYRVRASNSSGTSSNSNKINVLVKPAIPSVNAASSVGQTSFTANWSSVTGASEYRLDVSADNFTTFVSGYNNVQVLGTSKSVTGLSGGPFKYRVRAANASGSSGSSSAQLVDLASVASPSTGTQVTQCGIYAIYYYGLINARAEVHLNTVSGTLIETLGAPPNSLSAGMTNTVSASSLTAGNNYQIKVYENGNPLNYALSGIFSVVAVQPVALISLVSKTHNTLRISWTTVAGASTYGIDVATTDDFSSGVVWSNHSASPSDASGLDITGLTPDATYYVRIKANLSCVSTAYSSTYNWTTCPAISGATANAATTVKATSFVANWNAVTGATAGYDISVTLGTHTTIYTSAAGTTSSTISTLHPSSDYTYKVRGKSTCSASDYSSDIYVTTLELPEPHLNYGGGDGEDFDIAWDPIPEADYYEVQVSNSIDFSVITDSGTPTEETFGFAYDFCTDTYFRIRAHCAAGDYSAWHTERIPAGACGDGGRIAADKSPDKKEPSSVNEEFVVSPNPVETILRVSLPSKMKKKTLNFSFIDVTGRTFSSSVQLFSDYAEIDVRPMPSGLYILSVSDGVNMHRRKVVRK